jgi:hypothetical protein
MKFISGQKDAVKKASLWRWLGLGFCLLLLGVAVLPMLLGSRWVYGPLLRRLEAGDFRLSVGAAQLRWFSPLVFRDIAIQESDGPELLKIRQVRTDRGLFASLLSGRRIGRLEIVDPQLDIELLTDGSNLTRLIDALDGKLQGTEPSDGTVSKPPAIDIDVVVNGLTVRVQHADRDQPLVVIPPIEVVAEYRAVDGASTLHVEPAKLLREVAITPELMRLGLGYAIPVLAKSAWFDGRISIETGPIDILLDAPKDATGSATITLHEVRSGPSEPVMIQILDLMAHMRGRSPQHELVFIDGSKIDIQVANRQVTHSGLKLGLPRIDPRLQLSTSGSVGLVDRSLDLIVDLPVPVELLARREEVRDLGIPTIRLPIQGNLDEPRVEWSALRGEGADLLGTIGSRIAEEAPGTAAVLSGLESLADGQADQAIGAAIDLLREIRRARQSRNETTASDREARSDAQQTERPAPNRPILDALRKRLRDEPKQK